MIKNIHFILFIILFFNDNNAFCQWNNLVPNYSFETNNKWSPLTGSNGWNDPCYDVSVGPCDTYDNIVEYWSHIDSWTHPLYGCLFKGFVPTADIKKFNYQEQGSTDPQTIKPTRFNGEYYGHTSGEYLIAPLEGCFTNSCINSSKYYYIEFYFDGTDDVNVWLSESQPTHCAVNNNTILGEQIIVVTPQNENVANPNDYYKWKKYSGYFKPSSNNFKWITFGTSGHWDDIKIYEVDDNLCRNEWYFDNTVFVKDKEIFQAGEFIKAGTGVDPEAEQLDGPVTVMSGAHTIFTAGNAIILEPGFEVEQGAIFETDTMPCKDLCPDFINFPNKNCVSQPTQIGNTIYENTYVQISWQSASYLDNPNSPNPTFTPPQGSGEITYYATYTSPECGTSNLLVPIPFHLF